MNWIKIEDRLPDEVEFKKNYGWFLVWLEDCTRCYVERFDKYDKLLGNGFDHGWKKDWIGKYITHWMPLPKSP